MGKCMVCHQEHQEKARHFICFDCYSELDLKVANLEEQKKTSESMEEE